MGSWLTISNLQIVPNAIAPVTVAEPASGLLLAFSLIMLFGVRRQSK
jgi:hypothetical protein